jgi:hypothetical protein
MKVKVLQMRSILARRHADACLKGMLMHAAERAIIVYLSYEKTRLTELALTSPDSHRQAWIGPAARRAGRFLPSGLPVQQFDQERGAGSLPGHHL